MARPSMSLSVVGADFPNRRGPTRRFEIALCKPGEPVELRPEPDNPADRRAVAVFSSRGIQIGYLTAERCGLIAQSIASGKPVRAIFQSNTPYGALVRISFNGSPPLLPPIRQELTSTDDPDFRPDPIYPDE